MEIKKFKMPDFKHRLKPDPLNALIKVFQSFIDNGADRESLKKTIDNLVYIRDFWFYDSQKISDLSLTDDEKQFFYTEADGRILPAGENGFPVGIHDKIDSGNNAI